MPRSATSSVLAALTLAAGLALFPTLSAGAPTKSIPFVFSDIDGKLIRLADYRGQWVLVAFWAPWCPLCKVQMPALRQLDDRPDFTVVGVGLDYDSPSALRKTADNFDMAFAIVAGGKRRDPKSPHRQVGPVDFFPTSYLYDPNGEIVMYIPGQAKADKVLAFMERWQAGPTTASTPSRTDKLADFVRRQYGKSGEQAYGEWRQMVERAAGLDVAGKLERANDFFNRRLRISSDQRIWGKADHWATLGEVLGK
jgi:peroxiredoxin